MNSAVVRLDYDDFNTLLSNGDGTMEIEVIAGSAVEDLCDICCESGHSWTPDACCGDTPPCTCPPGVQSISDVTLVYLDCDVIGEPFDCVTNSDCPEGSYCSGTESCVDGACVATGNPCLATGKICNELTKSCRDCTTDAQCRDEDGLYCNGNETCRTFYGTCQSGSPPCTSGETCDETSDECVPNPVCTGTGCP